MDAVMELRTLGRSGNVQVFMTMKSMEGFITRGGLERDGHYLVIKEARAEEAQKEVERWLRKIKML